MKQTLKDKLLVDAVFVDMCLYHSIKEYANPNNVLCQQNKKWRVWLHDAKYQTGLVLTVFKDDCPIYIEPVERTIFIGTSLEWSQDEIKELFTDSFIDILLASIKANRAQGDVISKGKSKEVTLWNFHNYKIYYQK